MMLEALAVTDAITDIHQACQILNLQVAPDLIHAQPHRVQDKAEEKHQHGEHALHHEHQRRVNLVH